MSSYFDHFILICVNSFISDSTLILMTTIIMISWIMTKVKIIPSRILVIINALVLHWNNILKENNITNSNQYAHIIQSLFLYLLMINILGFVLYTFPVTTHISLTFGLGLSAWLGVNLMGLWNFKHKYLSMFMPNGSPLGLAPFLIAIELASHLSKPIALGMRLAANLTAGHILLAILADFSSKLILKNYILVSNFPILIIIFMTGLELGVLFIQAYVFCLLITIYLKDSIELH